MQIAVLTGADREVGQITAKLLSRRGYHVLLFGTDQDRLNILVRHIAEEGGQSTRFQEDIFNPDVMERLAERIKAEIGVPQVIVNLAENDHYAFIDETSNDDVIQMMSVPFFASFFLVRGFSSEMIERGNGYILTVTSPAALFPYPGAMGVSAANAAMRSLGLSLRYDLHETGVNSGLLILNEDKDNPRIPEFLRTSIRPLAPQQIADHIIAMIESEQRLRIVPIELRLALFVARVFPGLAHRILQSTGTHRPPKQ